MLFYSCLLSLLFLLGQPYLWGKDVGGKRLKKGFLVKCAVSTVTKYGKGFANMIRNFFSFSVFCMFFNYVKTYRY